MAITSPLPGEGKTTVAVNLALTLAQRGSRVLLVDGDLRRGTIAAVFGIEQQPGLSDVLLEAVQFGKAKHSVQVSETGWLHVISCGRPFGNPAQLLGSTQAHTLFEFLRAEYDSVIVDTPPANVVADAAVIGAHSDGVIVVARAGVTECRRWRSPWISSSTCVPRWWVPFLTTSTSGAMLPTTRPTLLRAWGRLCPAHELSGRRRCPAVFVIGR